MKIWRKTPQRTHMRILRICTQISTNKTQKKTQRGSGSTEGHPRVRHGLGAFRAPSTKPSPRDSWLWGEPVLPNESGQLQISLVLATDTIGLSGVKWPGGRNAKWSPMNDTLNTSTPPLTMEGHESAGSVLNRIGRMFWIGPALLPPSDR